MKPAAALLAFALGSASGVARAEAPGDASAVEVRGATWGSPRGAGDVVVQRRWLEASPRQQTSELLTAAPGFFVDHEDGEGFGNDVYLRGFDLEHGSGIEMRLGLVPVNVPTHVQGQGYADVNFIIPEAVRGLRVQQGPYDPRQGDSAIVGTASFDLGIPERGYQLKGSYGSFGQRRALAIVAPRDADPDTFVALSARSTDGFGTNRDGRSASLNAQYALDLTPRDRLKLTATGYGAASNLAGVVRADDVASGRLGFYDRYPFFAGGQSVRASRVLAAAEWTHDLGGGARVVATPFYLWTDHRARQNYTGSLQTSELTPSLSALGDLFETRNREHAAGLVASYRTTPLPVARGVDAVVEPGLYLRHGASVQGKSLLVPETLATWDRRLDLDVSTLDVGTYVDVDLRLWKRLRIAGGPRVDFLRVGTLDRLANAAPEGFPPPSPQRDPRGSVSGVAVGPRVTLEYGVTDLLSVTGSYGEGYRSLDAGRRDGTTPYSRVRSVEAGVRAHDARRRYTTTLAVFQTWVGDELVFVAEQGGLETQRASNRHGVVGALLAQPAPWLLASTALSVTSAEYETRVPGISHFVPSVPPVLLHTDVSVRGVVLSAGDRPVTGRFGAGYTFLSGRRLSDDGIAPAVHALNLGAQLRYGIAELGLELYNALDLEYADTAERFRSNFSVAPGQTLATRTTHFTAAPPRAALATVTLYL